MGTLIKFCKMLDEAQYTQQFLLEHSIKSYVRERDPEEVAPGEDPYGFDVFVLRDDDLAEAKELLEKGPAGV